MLRLRNFNVLSKLCSRVEWFVWVVSTSRCRRWECTLPSSVGVSALLNIHDRVHFVFILRVLWHEAEKSAEVESIRCNSAIRKSLREWLHPRFASQQGTSCPRSWSRFTSAYSIQLSYVLRVQNNFRFQFFGLQRFWSIFKNEKNKFIVKYYGLDCIAYTLFYLFLLLYDF